jgi:hypothetical protein
MTLAAQLLLIPQMLLLLEGGRLVRVETQFIYGPVKGS